MIRENAMSSAGEILAKVFEALSRFTQGLPCNDDVTLVIVKVE